MSAPCHEVKVEFHGTGTVQLRPRCLGCNPSASAAAHHRHFWLSSVQLQLSRPDIYPVCQRAPPLLYPASCIIIATVSLSPFIGWLPTFHHIQAGKERERLLALDSDLVDQVCTSLRTLTPTQCYLSVSLFPPGEILGEVRNSGKGQEVKEKKLNESPSNDEPAVQKLSDTWIRTSVAAAVMTSVKMDSLTILDHSQCLATILPIQSLNCQDITMKSAKI